MHALIASLSSVLFRGVAFAVVVVVEIVGVDAVFMEEVTVVVIGVFVEIIEVVAVFMEEVVAFVVVVAAAVVEVDVHAVDDIDPEDPVNMLSFVAFEFT